MAERETRFVVDDVELAERRARRDSRARAVAAAAADLGCSPGEERAIVLATLRTEIAWGRELGLDGAQLLAHVRQIAMGRFAALGDPGTADALGLDDDALVAELERDGGESARRRLRSMKRSEKEAEKERMRARRLGEEISRLVQVARNGALTDDRRRQAINDLRALDATTADTESLTLEAEIEGRLAWERREAEREERARREEQDRFVAAESARMVRERELGRAALARDPQADSALPALEERALHEVLP